MFAGGAGFGGEGGRRGELARAAPQRGRGQCRAARWARGSAPCRRRTALAWAGPGRGTHGQGSAGGRLQGRAGLAGRGGGGRRSPGPGVSVCGLCVCRGRAVKRAEGRRRARPADTGIVCSRVRGQPGKFRISKSNILSKFSW